MQDKRTENDETEEPDDAKELKRRTTRKGHARAGRECDGGSHHDDGHEAQDAAPTVAANSAKKCVTNTYPPA